MTQNERRELWTVIHRYLGLTAMLFLAIAVITGCILCFAMPLDRALNADLFYRQGPLHGTAPIGAVERFITAVPALRVTGFPLNVEAQTRRMAAIMGQGEWGSVLPASSRAKFPCQLMTCYATVSDRYVVNRAGDICGSCTY